MTSLETLWQPWSPFNHADLVKTLMSLWQPWSPYVNPRWVPVTTLESVATLKSVAALESLATPGSLWQLCSPCNNLGVTGNLRIPMSILEESLWQSWESLWQPWRLCDNLGVWQHWSSCNHGDLVTILGFLWQPWSPCGNPRGVIVITLESLWQPWSPCGNHGVLVVT